jgi:hypothetical protein
MTYGNNVDSVHTEDNKHHDVDVKQRTKVNVSRATQIPQERWKQHRSGIS